MNVPINLVIGKIKMDRKIKVYDIKDALRLVREIHPTATMQGSTYDWSFYVNDLLVAIALCNRRVKRDEWMLTIKRINNND